MKHETARGHAEAGIKKALGRDPNRGEVLALLAVAWLESQYGQGWRGDGVGSNNMGAIQAGSKWKGPTFVYTDTHPNADGTSTRYQTKFRKYPSAAEGFGDLARVMYIGSPGTKWDRSAVLAAAAREDWLAVSQKMRESVYYEGFGATREQQVMNHQKAFASALSRIANALNIDVQLTLMRGSSGSAVAELQEALRELLRDEIEPVIRVDGLFGPETEAWLRHYQMSRDELKQIGDYLPGVFDHATQTAMAAELLPNTEPPPAPPEPPEPEGCPV